MRALIVCTLILIVYGYFLISHINNDVLFGNPFIYAMDLAKSEEIQEQEVQKFIVQNLSIKNWNDLYNVMKKDSTVTLFNDSSFCSSLEYKNIMFYFDDDRNLKHTAILNFRTHSVFADNEAYYAPILSYIFQSKKYSKYIGWWRLHFIWKTILIIIGILVLYNIIRFSLKRHQRYLTNLIFFCFVVLVINYLHSIFFNVSTINDECNLIVRTGQLISPESFLEWQGLVTHYQALISDVNIIAIILLGISVYLLVKFKNQHNPLLNADRFVSAA